MRRDDNKAILGFRTLYTKTRCGTAFGVFPNFD